MTGFKRSIGFYILILFSVFPSSRSYSASPPTQSTPLNKSAIMTTLQSLYPYFTSSQIEDKIASTKDPDHFLRSFVPYYYFSLRNNPQWGTPIASISGEGGWCVGDAHFSNFGVILNANGNPDFTINDMDDSGPCHLAADTLRFLTSIILSKPQANLAYLMQAYQSGLNNKSDQFSPVLQNLLQQGRQMGRVLNPKLLAEPSRMVRPPSSRELTGPEIGFVNQAIKSSWGVDTIMLDSFENAKSDGGSQDLPRYMVLIKLGAVASANQGLVGNQILEFKQEVLPGISSLATKPIPGTADRILETLTIEQGAGYSHLYNVARFGTMDFLISPRWLGNIKLSPKDFSDQDFFAIVADEFYTLGAIHSRTASSSYVQGVEHTSVQTWIQVASSIAQFMTLTFETVH